MSKRNKNNMPKNFTPPVPAWSSNWGSAIESFTCAFFAVQGELNNIFKQWKNDFLESVECTPEHIEQAQFVDREGIKNHIFISYWGNNKYEQWQQNNPKAFEWWNSSCRLSENVGYWYEVYSTPVNRMETIHSTPNAHGVANLSVDIEGPIEEHAYPGAARDRVEISGSEDVTATLSIKEDFHKISSNNGRRVVFVPPKNMCIIRSGQDWGHCETEERDFYLKEVHPTLIAGMDYLAEHAEESRCLSMRLMTSVNEQGDALPQTFGLGYGLDILAFENWAKSHPTHLKIFGSFMQHAQKFADKMQLRLWHEVTILAANSAKFEYINCHNKTGLLAYC